MSAYRVLRRGVAAAARTAAFARAVDALERVARIRPRRLAVLTYHRVDDPDRRPDLYPGLVSATPDEFEEQVRFLSTRYRLVSAADVLDVRRGARELPSRAVLITFDDAYRDVGELAWPILARHGAPAILFVPTAYPGEPERAFWWDSLYHALTAADAGMVETALGVLPLRTHAERIAAYRRLRAHVHAVPHEDAVALLDAVHAQLRVPPPQRAVLTWDELRALAAGGLALGAHTRTHPLLNRIAPSRLAGELAGALDDLEARLGAALPILAYPGGASDGAVVAAAADAGYELAFTGTGGTNDLARADWLGLRRLNVGPLTGLGVIRARLLPWPGSAARPAAAASARGAA